MRRINSILLTVVFCFAAQLANAFTLNVKIDDASRIKEVASFPAQASTVDFSSGECVLTFVDDEYPNMRQAYVSPAQGKYITRYEITDEDGNVLDGKTVNKTTRVGISIPLAADYGTLYIYTSDELPKDAKVTVNLSGDPKKVAFSVNASRNINLKVGENIVEYNSVTEKTFYLMPVGVATLYKVSVNGVENQGQISGAEGELSKTYYIYPKDGDVIDIETNFPDVDHAISITTAEGMEQLIKSVTVDGKAVADWQSLATVKGGQEVCVKTNPDAIITSFLVNGVDMVYYDAETQHYYWSHEWKGTVTEPMTIRVEGYMIERNMVVKTRTYGWENVMNIEDIDFETEPTVSGMYKFARFDGTMLAIADGEGEVRIAESDNPFTLVVSPLNGEDVDVSVTLNGEPVAMSFYACTLELKDGDELTIAYDTVPEGVSDVVVADGKGGEPVNTIGQKVGNGYRGVVIIDGKKILKK